MYQPRRQLVQVTRKRLIMTIVEATSLGSHTLDATVALLPEATTASMLAINEGSR
jgi:hypothetical protein